MKRGRAARQRGHAIVEVALMAPWVFFLFIGVFDFGFYAYALISVENAARAAALYTSGGGSSAADSAGACQYALGELNQLPNTRALVNCNALPVIVTAQAIDAASSVDGRPASRVTVRYQTVALIPIPGLLSGQLDITRTAEMRLRQ